MIYAVINDKSASSSPAPLGAVAGGCNLRSVNANVIIVPDWATEVSLSLDHEYEIIYLALC